MAGVPRSNSHTGSPDFSSPARTESDKVAAAARLKGVQSKSPTAGAATSKPESMTPIQASTQAKKPRPTKWQFGIRSRNSPAEAMLAIYKALSAMGADWEDVEPRTPPGAHSSEHHSRKRTGSNGSRTSPDSSSSSSDNEAHSNPNRSPYPNGRNQHRSSSSSTPDSDEHGHVPDPTQIRHRHRHHRRSSDHQRHGPWDDWGYAIPADPWIIHARFRKDGLFPPDIAQPLSASSARSSKVDLAASGDEKRATRRRSGAGIAGIMGGGGGGEFTGPGSTAGSVHSANASVGAAGAASGFSSARASLSGSAAGLVPDHSVYVYVTIQLYCIEREFFLVDFKCAGYERVERQMVREALRRGRKGEEWVVLGEEENVDEGETEVREREEWVGGGRVTEEKDITSRFPCLDVAARLIIQLAEAD